MLFTSFYTRGRIWYEIKSNLHVRLKFQHSLPIFYGNYLVPKKKILTVLRKHMFSRRAPTVPKKEMIKIKKPTTIMTIAGSVEILENSL